MRGARAVEDPGFKPPVPKKIPPKVKAEVDAMKKRIIKKLDAWAEKTDNAPLFGD
jgi:hypothetical protein